MFVPMKCVILITQVALQASHRKLGWCQNWQKVIQEYFISWMANIAREVLPNTNILHTKNYFEKFLLLFSRNEMRPLPLSQLWQIALQSALNSEINHCFPPGPPIRPNVTRHGNWAVFLLSANHISQEREKACRLHLNPFLPCFDSHLYCCR